jgi:hypothetical protein
MKGHDPDGVAETDADHFMGEFRLGGTEIDGTPMTAIVCEGVVVESWPIQFM